MNREVALLVSTAILSSSVACGPAGGEADSISDTIGGSEGWPVANEWSWNGSWAPGGGEFPLGGLLDDEYFDGHADSAGDPTPILPPGAWDWSDPDDDLANWRNFSTNVGSFEPLVDSSSRQHGWRLVPVDPAACDYSGPAMYFEGSSGADVLDLGPDGSVHSFAEGNLADGPDVLMFRSSWSLDFRTGSSLTGHERDDDLVVAGCAVNGDGAFDVMTSTLHTGPGSDWVFVRNLSRAAVDLGDGDGGRTDSVDPFDGDDLVVLGGNTNDFRVMAGAGNDVAVWRVDENVQTTTWLGPNFFGEGGYGDALWVEGSVDRLVMAVPDGTPIATSTPTPEGALLVMGTSGEYIDDDPTLADPFARYCVECGVGPGGRKTVILEYDSLDGAVRTGYFYVTSFEELQVGVGPGAVVYSIDDVLGTVATLASAVAFRPPDLPLAYCP